jgi:hypothetical protein
MGLQCEAGRRHDVRKARAITKAIGKVAGLARRRSLKNLADCPKTLDLRENGQ